MYCPTAAAAATHLEPVPIHIDCVSDEHDVLVPRHQVALACTSVRTHTHTDQQHSCCLQRCSTQLLAARDKQLPHGRTEPALLLLQHCCLTRCCPQAHSRHGAASTRCCPVLAPAAGPRTCCASHNDTIHPIGHLQVQQPVIRTQVKLAVGQVPAQEKEKRQTDRVS